MKPSAPARFCRAGRDGIAAALAAFIVIGCDVEPAAPAADASDCCPEDAAPGNPAEKFVGVWDPVGSPRDLESEAEPEFTPTTTKSVERQKELRDAGNISYDYSAVCIPPAAPTMTTLGPQEILVDEEKMTWIIEATSGIRWIWLDGRDHPPREELRPTAYGHSTARWDGETLVIDTVGFLDKAMVYVNLPGNVSIFPSPEMRFVERLQLAEDGEAIISERTLHDPVNLVEPWKTTVRYEKRDWELGETICMENNEVFFYFDPEDLPGADGKPPTRKFAEQYEEAEGT